ncbi:MULTISPECIES: amino acid--tRNA ligase-related protein [unclassified Oceanispirochaeta]|uniref:amino acid--tRNA ligase-related protein n=1 Tax=unclassified Oceanispirochaeta TaxID=2635722 RepID=UPI000E09B27C|nr:MULTISPECIES: amino acid--tRNA ligase-related protein [unclassified Oceanispirochaeta]MBF9014733.1 elongation factor P--(R)-beta-lysine ligase [Oceanispirochaeta sp. M2]NPD70989.1 elongation factor P--(R)-beta-lysine ligase [Oceanispirochaeta sp. M1]RDG33822.1 elongation factor P--(R)-beta-lysine ligase [Oceanispirochaeta sp. M1]
MNLSIDKIKKRAVLINRIRNFFFESDFLEVDTPLLSPHLIPESSIENFKASLISPYRDDIPLYLTPSPEIWMKQLLAQGSGDIFQICKSFRNNEQISPVHNPEFTMLEWYKTGITADENIRICELLISSICLPETPDSCRPPFRQMTVEEAFIEFAGFSLEENMEIPTLLKQLQLAGIPAEENEGWEVLYHKLFLTLVEPELPCDRPLVLKNYPRRLATLAADIEESPWSDRWELYMDGTEIANCYTEETDIEKIRNYYEKEGQKKSLNSRVPVRISSSWVKGMKDFPSCSGTAIGVDRLTAALIGDKSIQGVILFPLDAILPEAKNS